MATCNVRFMNNSHVTTSNLTATSELSAFPATNVANSSRSRVHKTGGYFEITTSNQNLYIDDGSPKTVAITVGSYTTGAALATQIQTDLNSASSGWTVTYDLSGSTYKFTLANTGSVDIVLSSTANAIWDTIGFTGTTDRTGTSFLADEQRNHSFERWVIDLGAPQEMSYLAAIGPQDEVFWLSDEGTAKWKANNVNLWDSPAYEKTVANDPRGILHFPEDDTNWGAYRYWAFEITDRRNPLGPQALKIGNLYIGTYDTITSSNVARGFGQSRSDESRVQVSEGGQRYFDERPKYSNFQGLEIQNITLTDLKTIDQVFEDQGISRPFWLSLDPELVLSDVLSDETKYVTFSGSPQKTQVFLNYWTVRFDAREDL